MEKPRKLFGRWRRINESKRSSSVATFSSSQQALVASLPAEEGSSSTDSASVRDPPEHRSRLIELSENGDQKKVDVVAVHGLQGGALKTWRHGDGSMWLQDFLPTEIDDARIMTFGYESRIAFSKSAANLEEKALDLLNLLGPKRDRDRHNDSRPRPIVFICHSLGGIVVKKALVLAHERSSDRFYKDVLDNTKAIAFIGVPHKGSDSAYWGNFGARLMKSTSLGTSTNTNLVAGLQRDSTILTSISTQFIERARNLQIFTFYETKKLRGVLVVDSLSARMNIPNEKVIPLDGDHREICKISREAAESSPLMTYIVELARLAVVEATESAKPQLLEKQEASYHEVPNRLCRSFVGREDILSRIDQAFSTEKAPRIAVLQGLGGQGKSQIALEYCRRSRDSQVSAIFWIDSTNEATVIRSFESVSERVRLQTDYLPDAAPRVDFVLQRLASWSSKWLMVFDNYDDPLQFPNIEDFFPRSVLGAILVTGRHTDAAVLVGKETSDFIELHGLGEEAALELLIGQSHSDESVSEASKSIVERLGYHPLAIAQAAAFIWKRKLKFSEFETQYQHRKRVILETTPHLSQYRRKLGNTEGEVSLSVFTTWELSFQQLQTQVGKDGIEIKALTLFAFFDNENIDEGVFYSYVSRAPFDLLNSFRAVPTSDCSESSESSETFEASLEWLQGFLDDEGLWEPQLFEDCLITLRDLSLLQAFTREPDGFRAVLHPLIKDWIRLRTPESVCREYTLMGTIILRESILDRWPIQDLPITFSAKPKIFVHALAQETNHEEYLPLQELSKLSRKRAQKYLEIQVWIAECLADMEYHSLAERMMQRIKMGWEKILGAEHSRTLHCICILAYIYYLQGRLQEAEQLYMQVLELLKKVAGNEHSSTLTCMSDLAKVYQTQRRWEEADKLYRLVEEVRTKVSGADHVLTLDDMGTLASSYQSQGRTQEAIELHRQVLEASKKLMGADNIVLWHSMNALAWIYQFQGRLQEAYDLCVPVLEGREKLYGMGDFRTWSSMNILASNHQSRGRLQEAAELHWQVVEAKKVILGMDDRETLSSIDTLASDYRSQGRFEEAHDLLIQVLVGEKKMLGADHLDTLFSMQNLASNCRSQGRFQEAHDLLEQVSEREKKVLGMDHPRTLVSMHYLALNYQCLGQLSEAHDLLVQVLEARKKALGADDPDTLESMELLAKNYENQGRLQEAEDLLVQVIEARKRALGADDPATLNPMSTLALVYDAQGRSQKFEEMGSQALEAQERVLSPEQRASNPHMAFFAEIYRRLGRLKEAEDLFISTLEANRRKLGPGDQNTVFCIRALVEMYQEQGRNVEAEKLLDGSGKESLKDKKS
ncbi:MAG: hypothetical protein M4579_000376 [Chaenotheca gracillima]|nr:MAG: hypothetical protein M4579_000376 [Chaenotheca gracillima]